MPNYDLTVHMDEDGDPILEGTSPEGIAYVESIRGDVPKKFDLVITCSAEEFMENLPRKLTVCMLHSPSGMTQKLCPPPLH